MSPARRASGMDQDAQLATLDERVRQLREQATSANTWRAYHSDFTRWSRWAVAHQLPALPAQPQDLARYLEQAADPATAGDDEAGAARAVSPATITRWLSSIRWVHRHTGHPDPTTDLVVQGALTGLRHDVPRRPRRAPLGVSDVERILAAMDASPTRGQALAEVRDRALILLSFTTGLRSAELIALRIEDLEAAPSGLTVHVRRNRQLGHDDIAVRDVVVPRADHRHLDPTLALEAWLRRLRATLATHPDPAGEAPDHPDAPPTTVSTGKQLRALFAELTGPVFRSITRHGRLGAQGRPDAPPDAPLGHNAIRHILARRRDAGLKPTADVQYVRADSARISKAT
ncbi:tyrosine-type recombinase/integrase [Kineococcus sp. SYSU DK005]|uniref:tyrosine-type recombinase/integrase n=1 Tax=Kineococcus sp. SYSU DK005 TaxID=3383126 RepID=UPI003D7DA606